MKKALSIFVNVLAWIFLILALLITIMVFSSSKNNGVANLFGFMPMAVESDSMKPTFKQGDLIICKEIDDFNAIKENDVITFWTTIEGQRVKNTHRIVEVINDEGTVKYVTKGDNNAVKDSDIISQGAVIGSWTNVKLPLVGKILDFIRTKTGFFICIVIPMAIFFLFELYKFIATIIEAKRPESVEVDEDEIKRRAIEEYLAAQKKAEGTADNAKDTAENIADKVGSLADNAADKAEALVDKAESAVETAAETVASKAADEAEAIGNAAEAIADTAEDKILDANDTVAEAVEDAVETVKAAD